ncbi:MAG: hypothetical protein F6K19_04970 [Cyanothece sp. SIO1E1]|nr:hypothetical protein [Cyanothece sp. SIO1E1]
MHTQFPWLFGKSAHNSDIEITTAAKQEILRQARWGFNLYFMAISATVIIGGIGGTLLLLGKTTEGTVTTAAGFASGAYCTQLAQESRSKLQQLTQYDSNPDKG